MKQWLCEKKAIKPGIEAKMKNAAGVAKKKNKRGMAAAASK